MIIVMLLFIIGFLIMAFAHLVIPICFAISRKRFPEIILWLIAAGGALLGFIVCALLAEQFRGALGVINSAFWLIIGYVILKIFCRKKK